MCFILNHGAALETASCDLSTLSASNGDKRTQTGGAEVPSRFLLEFDVAQSPAT
jgi:hypothetical protein